MTGGPTLRGRLVAVVPVAAFGAGGATDITERVVAQVATL